MASATTAATLGYTAARKSVPTFKFKGRLEKIVSNIERDGLYTTNYSSQNDGWKELEEILFLEPENADAWLCMALRNYYNQSFYSYLQKALQLGVTDSARKRLAILLFPGNSTLCDGCLKYEAERLVLRNAMWHSEVVVLRISKIWERTRINIGLGKDAKDAERARKVLAGLARNILSHHSDWTHRLPVELRTLPDSSDSMRVRQEDRPGTQPRTRKLGPVIAALLLFASVMILFMPYNPVNPNHSALYEVITAFSCAISGATMCLNLYCPKQSGLVRWGWGFLVGVIWFSVVFYATALIMGRT